MEQAILFPIDKYTTADARTWLDNHGFKPIKHVHKTKHFYRYRLKQPRVGARYYIIKMRNGILRVMMEI